MSVPNGPARNEWLAPANILAFLGMLGLVFTSYQTFQRDTQADVAELKYRIDADEHTIAVLQNTREDQAKLNNDLALRLDRLEHRR